LAWRGTPAGVRSGRCRCPSTGGGRSRGRPGRTALVAGGDVDGRVGDRTRVVVEVAPIDVGVDAAHGVDRLAEAAEVDVHHLVDLQPVRRFTVWRVSGIPPFSKAALSLSVPMPGMLTLDHAAGT
jgi:hypothetical protein